MRAILAGEAEPGSLGSGAAVSRGTRGTIGWYVRKRMGVLGPQRQCMGNYPELKAVDVRS